MLHVTVRILKSQKLAAVHGDRGRIQRINKLGHNGLMGFGIGRRRGSHRRVRASTSNECGGPCDISPTAKVKGFTLAGTQAWQLYIVMSVTGRVSYGGVGLSSANVMNTFSS